MNLIRLIIAFLVLPVAIQADTPVYMEVSAGIDSLPSVFMIGEYEYEYENLVQSCDMPLLEVCQDSMQLAYKHWLLMLHSMENYAETVDFDIKGMKIWLNVFWNEDGSIEQLVYYPKPNSRNADFTLLTKFFKKFQAQYILPVNYEGCFSHYGSATFPTFAKLYLQEEP